MKAALFCLAAAALLGAVEASHFRYGSVVWQATKDQPDANALKVRIQLEMAIRRSWANEREGYDQFDQIGGAVTFSVGNNGAAGYGDGQTFEEMPNSIVTVSDPVQDILMAVWSTFHSYDKSNGPYTFFYTDCCRLKAYADVSAQERASYSYLNNNDDGPWRLTVKIDPAGVLRKSPTASFVPMVEIGSGGVQTIEMYSLASTPLDDSVYSLADTARMDGTQPNTDTSIYNIHSSTGILSWDTTGVTIGFWCTQVLVGSSSDPTINIPVDFFIFVKPEVGLCIDSCDNSGTECTAGGSGTCSGACVGDNVQECQPNQYPSVIVEPSFRRMVNTAPLTFDVTFEPMSAHETYQNYVIVTGSIPSDSSYVYTPGTPADTGSATVTFTTISEPEQYIICFVAYDYFSYGVPKCTKIDFFLPALPELVFDSPAPKPKAEHKHATSNDLYKEWMNQTFCFEMTHGAYLTDPATLAFNVDDKGADEATVTSLSSSTMKWCLDIDDNQVERTFDVCFSVNDGYTFSESKCVTVQLYPKPPFECVPSDTGGYDNFDDCLEDPRCYWDMDGVNEHHDGDTRGCYVFVECQQMNFEKKSCLAHKNCKYTRFQECVDLEDNAREVTDSNPSGDPCRQYVKKECREVDGNERHPQHRHCVWDPVNQWCQTTELHMPFVDLCRRINNYGACKRAIRNGYRCKWNFNEDLASEAKCRRGNPVNDNTDPFDLNEERVSTYAKHTNVNFDANVRQGYEEFTAEGFDQHQGEKAYRTDRSEFYTTEEPINTEFLIHNFPATDAQ